MNRHIFVSLTKEDTPIAEALRTALKKLVGDTLTVHFSTSTEVGAGPGHGEDWFEWIVREVEECDFAFILVTPASAQKPWILWEAGAVQGAAGREGRRKVRPILFQVTETQLPSPIRESKVQFRRGDAREQVESLFKDVINEYKNDIGIDRLGEAWAGLPKVAETFLASVTQTLLRAPGVATSVAVEAWLSRLDALLKENRRSEIGYLQDWMEIAFGRDSPVESRPLDLRVHTRLGDVYLATRNYPRAVVQFELARSLAPRDIYILRSLGRAYLETQEPASADRMLQRIEELDGQAFLRNAECAALKARYLRESGRLADAVAVIGRALEQNPDSYYLANLHGEALLESGDVAQARVSFGKALTILSRLRETNIWTLATAANAAFVVGEDARVADQLKAILAQSPDADELATIEKGLRRLAPLLDQGDQRMAAFAAVLHPAPAGDRPAV